MNVDHLRLFVTTARMGNLTRAAIEFDLAQPTASRWLHALDTEVGGPLFVRAPGGLALTALGRAFLPYAERSVRVLRDGVEHAQQVRAGLAGRLLIGCSEVTSTYFLPAVLRGFVDMHPDVDVRVQTGSSAAISESVARRDLDVALVGSDPVSPRLETLLLDADAHVFVVAPSDPLTQPVLAELSQVGDRGVILYSIGEPAGPYGLAPFMAAHIAPRVVMEVDTIETAKRMAAQGFGVALLPRMAVDEDLATGRLRVVTVGADLGHWHVRASRPAKVEVGGPVAAFWNWCARRSSTVHVMHEQIPQNLAR